MSPDSKNFLGEIIEIIEEKYNDSCEGEGTENELDKQFRLGMNIAYYDVLDIISEQIEVWGFDSGYKAPMIVKKKDREVLFNRVVDTMRIG
jgi:hypothetical protein